MGNLIGGTSQQSFFTNNEYFLYTVYVPEDLARIESVRTKLDQLMGPSMGSINQQILDLLRFLKENAPLFLNLQNFQQITTYIKTYLLDEAIRHTVNNTGTISQEQFDLMLSFNDPRDIYRTNPLNARG